MTITAIAFNNLITAAIPAHGTDPVIPEVPAVYADLAYDLDLRALHPDMDNNRWKDETSFRGVLSAAFDQLSLDLNGAGWTPALITNSAANRSWFKNPVIFGALVIIFRDFKADLNDRWAMLQNEYQVKYDSLVKTAKLDYDDDESGDIGDGETGLDKGVTLTR